MAAAARYEIDGDVAVIVIDNPPVNALGHAVRAAVFDALDRAVADPAVAAIVLTGGDRAFSGGADITEFGKPPVPPVCLTSSTPSRRVNKPVVAAIAGFAFGGGLELALCLPGAGRSPRQPGSACPRSSSASFPAPAAPSACPALSVAAALDIIGSGDPIGAERAVGIGLVDALARGRPARPRQGALPAIWPAAGNRTIPARDQDGSPPRATNWPVFRRLCRRGDPEKSRPRCPTPACGRPFAWCLRHAVRGWAGARTRRSSSI